MKYCRLESKSLNLKIYETVPGGWQILMNYKNSNFLVNNI